MSERTPAITVTPSPGGSLDVIDMSQVMTETDRPYPAIHISQIIRDEQDRRSVVRQGETPSHFEVWPRLPEDRYRALAIVMDAQLEFSAN